MEKLSAAGYIGFNAKANAGTSSTTKGESADLNACPFAQAEDAKSDISGG